MRSRGLTPVGDAINILVDRVQGNLLAADQEIEKLKLLTGGGEVDGQAVARSVADSARFDVFALADSALLGDLARSIRVLDGLRAEGVEPTLVVWALSRELRTLSSVLFSVGQGQSLDRALTGAHVWSSKKAIVGRAARRLRGVARAHELLEHAARCDAACKGLGPGDAWHELASLLMALAADGQRPRRAG